MNILRRMPLSRLLLLCGLVVAIGASATALALALGSGPTPPPKPLPQAVHDALAAAPVEGVSASVKLTDHLLEGANLASGEGEAGQLAASPLLSGGSGRLWIAKDGRVRLELQAERGDTQILYDGHILKVYDAASNTLYRYTLPAHDADAAQSKAGAGALLALPNKPVTHTSSDGSTTAELTYTPEEGSTQHEVPSVAKIEEGVTKLGEHVNISGATPTNVAGQPAYTTRISPKEGGSLLGGAELSWDAVHGVPLRTAIYSSSGASPVIELAATEISYGPVADSVFEFTPPANAKIDEVVLPDEHAAKRTHGASGEHAHPKVTTHGHGVSSVAVIESKTKPGEKPPSLPEELQKVKVKGATATELPTALGTLLSFERAGVRYVLIGSVTPAALETVARGL